MALFPNLVEIKTIEEQTSSKEVYEVQQVLECAFSELVDLPAGVVPPIGCCGTEQDLAAELQAIGYEPWRYGVGKYFHPGPTK